jgi:hypothetical protein
MSALFWTALSRAFRDSEGFTVTFHLTGGQTIPMVAVSGHWTPEASAIEGERLDGEERLPVALRAAHVTAYEIEE